MTELLRWLHLRKYGVTLPNRTAPGDEHVAGAGRQGLKE